MFGIGGGGGAGAKHSGVPFEERQPKTKEDFEDLARYLAQHLRKYEVCPERRSEGGGGRVCLFHPSECIDECRLPPRQRSLLYTTFVRSLTRELCLGMKVDDVKEVGNLVTVLHNEKLKEQREASKGKKKCKGECTRDGAGCERQAGGLLEIRNPH
jgi:hypothetical protein